MPATATVAGGAPPVCAVAPLRGKAGFEAVQPVGSAA